MTRGASRSRARSINTHTAGRATSKKARTQQESSGDESGEYSWYGKEMSMFWSTTLLTYVFWCS